MAPVNLHAIGAGHARHDGQITRFGAAHTGYIGDVCVGRRRRALHIVRQLRVTDGNLTMLGRILYLGIEVDDALEIFEQTEI